MLTSVTVENDSSSHTRNAAKSWDVCSLSKPPASKLASAPVALSRYANVGASTGCLSASSSFHTFIAPERIGSDSAWKSLYLRWVGGRPHTDQRVNCRRRRRHGDDRAGAGYRRARAEANSTCGVIDLG